MAKCGIGQITDTECGESAKHQRKTKNEVILLVKCNRDISKHLQFCKISNEGISTEADLILCRAGIFASSRKENIVVCSLHRDSLGIYWRGQYKNCQVPISIAAHSKRSRGDRSVGKRLSQSIFERTNELLPVGSSICRRCREMYACTKIKPCEGVEDTTSYETTTELCPSVDTLIDTFQPLTIRGNKQDVSMYSPSCSQDTASSQEEPSASLKDSDTTSKNLERLNNFLEASSVGTVQHALSRPWSKLTNKTQSYYTNIGSSVLAEVIRTLAPESAGELWKAIKSSNLVDEYLGDEQYVGSDLLIAVAESYKQASEPETRLQLLSLVANKVSYKNICTYIPDLKRHQFRAARRHSVEFGAGQAVEETEKQVRQKIDPAKLEHFLDFITAANIIQDLPFGQKTLKLSSGDKLQIPNIIRTLIPSRLIAQYQQYCSENAYVPLSRATLYKILSQSCVASVRKSLQGLDNYAADGGRAFDDLIALMDTLSMHGLDEHTASKTKDQLLLLKQYIKGDYKVQSTIENSVADHCRTYALSDPKKKHFQEHCKHEHDYYCERCETLKEVLDFIVLQTKSLGLPPLIKDDAVFTAQTACDSIRTWKSHQLRMVHQDNARVDILDSLDESSALLVQDFAMKFLPKQYREAQAEFFGKRGISWHITVCMTKLSGELFAQTFVHIVESRVQNSRTVVTIMENVMQILKKEHPKLNTIYYRQDNAGCYHSALTVLSCKVLSERTGINLAQLDFCDPQGGKGPCDRKSAQIKFHINTYINEGHSVTTPGEFKTAIESNGGIPGVRVVYVKSPSKSQLPDLDDLKIDGISTLFNFVFTNSGVKAYKAYQVGTGISWRWSDYEGLSKIETLPWIDSDKVGDGDFILVKGRKHGRDAVDDSHPDQHGDHGEPEEPRPSQSKDLFACPEDGCIKTYMSHGRLEQHMMYGKHEYRLEKMSLLDKAKIGYAERLEAGAKGSVILPTKTSKERCHQLSSQGWALHDAGKTRKRFSEKQKEYLKKTYLEGERTGNKRTGDDVAKEMRFITDANGEPLFSFEEFLRPQQIQSFFSRLTAKKKEISLSDEETDEQRQEEAVLSQSLKTSLNKKINVHPLRFSGKNICEMTEAQLTNLKVVALRSMTTHFSIKVKGRKKGDYVQALHEFILRCECKNK